MANRFRRVRQLGGLTQDDGELLVAIGPSIVGYDRPLWLKDGSKSV
jgi:hypothetical protein